MGNVLLRFWVKVRMGDGCWEWISGRSKLPYPTPGILIRRY